jgi:3-hydroxyisobutyrate dehydrogenase-like beta-hydroxyacid dehydrogenase
MARRVGIVGLGLLGAAIAARLVRAGYEVVGFDVVARKRQSLADAGGRAAGSAREVAEDCDTLLFSLPDSTVVAGVIDQIGAALRPGMLLVDTTTGDPRDAETAGATLARRGVHYLDATVAGSSAQVYDGQVIVMAGGAREAFTVAREILAAFATEVFHVGPWGSGSRMKLVVNLVLGLNRAVLAEGITLARALELDAQAALDILRASAAYSRVMDTKGPKMLAEDFTPQAKLSQHAKDVRLILEAAERTGTELPLSVLHRTLLERAAAAGFAEADNSAIIRAFERPRHAHEA